MTLRTGGEELAEARGIIEPIVKEIDDGVEVTIDGGEGFYTDTVVVVLQKEGRRAKVIVTFEAWAKAKSDPSDLKQALHEILAEREAASWERFAFLVTSGGILRKPLDIPEKTLQEGAAFAEADYMAQQILGRKRN